MPSAAICEPVRTPIGRYGGMFRSLTVVDLAVAALTGLLERTGVPADVIDDVILGHCYPNPEAPALGRVVALDAGLPVTVGGMQVDRRCGSGLQSVIQACIQVALGGSEVVIAGGAESMSNVAFHSTDMRWGGAMVTVRSRSGDQVADTDEHPRADTSVETPAKLKPLLAEQDPDATVTAGNSSGQNDAASMCIVTTPEKAAQSGLRPLARLVSWGLAGVEPRVMGIGPVPATAVALSKAGLALNDIDVIELNEAFAAQALAVMREWGFTDADRQRTNVHGSGISLGHPVGATGGRMLATLARELHRRDARYGPETMCIGGGQGLAAVFEKVDPE